MRRVFSVLILSSKPLVTQKAASRSLPGRTIVSEILLAVTPLGVDAHPANIITIRKSEARMVTAMASRQCDAPAERIAGTK